MDRILVTLSKEEKTGYEIYKEIKKSGNKASSRIIYHYLYIALKEGKVTVENKNELGSFSWGNTANKKYYRLK